LNAKHLTQEKKNFVVDEAVHSHFAKTKTKLSFAFAFAKYRPK
jgi:hypothetical protein